MARNPHSPIDDEMPPNGPTSGATNGNADLEPPLLLIAMPQVMDPFFNHSVVLLIEHHDDGSLGFIVNRPTGVPILEILEGMKIDWQGEGEEKAHFGGPVQPQIGTVLYQTESTEDEVYPGVTLTQNVSDLKDLAESPPGKIRLYLGYAGWGPGQLMTEIQRNDWLMAPVNDELIFPQSDEDLDPAEVWRAALESVGVDPVRLPSWTSTDDPVN